MLPLFRHSRNGIGAAGGLTATPVPFSATVLVDWPTAPFTVRVPVRSPVPLGVKVRLMVQLNPAPKVPPPLQLPPPTTLNSDPVTVVSELANVSVAVPVFVTVATRLPVDPTNTPGKDTGRGVTVMTGATATPVPLSAADPAASA